MKKITDKVNFEVKAQGCSDDCKVDVWSGNTSFKKGCVHITGTPSSVDCPWW